MSLHKNKYKKSLTTKEDQVLLESGVGHGTATLQREEKLKMQWCLQALQEGAWGECVATSPEMNSLFSSTEPF